MFKKKCSLDFCHVVNQRTFNTKKNLVATAQCKSTNFTGKTDVLICCNLDKVMFICDILHITVLGSQLQIHRKNTFWKNTSFLFLLFLPCFFFFYTIVPLKGPKTLVFKKKTGSFKVTTKGLTEHSLRQINIWGSKYDSSFSLSSVLLQCRGQTSWSIYFINIFSYFEAVQVNQPCRKFLFKIFMGV